MKTVFAPDIAPNVAWLNKLLDEGEYVVACLPNIGPRRVPLGYRFHAFEGKRMWMRTGRGDLVAYRSLVQRGQNV